MNSTSRELALATIKEQFAILKRRVHGCRLAYLDNAASTQKPQPVIEAMVRCMRDNYSNIHRGVHYLSQQLTSECEQVRAACADFINAARSSEIIFTKSTTEGINLVANCLGELLLQRDDVVLISALEHHANIVPWQIVCARYGAKLRVVAMNDNGELQVDDFANLLKDVKIFSINHVSNALGTINDIAPLIAAARAQGIITVVDGAQAIAHLPIDVQALQCDFYAFSAHKIYGPTGLGILYGRAELLQKMPVYQGGGDMIVSVSFEGSEYAAPPAKFEAGTPPIIEIIGFGAALAWFANIGVAKIAAHECQLAAVAARELAQINGVTIYGKAAAKCAIISFTIKDVHAHDVGTILDQCGVAVRVGHHCAEPIMRHFGIAATVRASFAAYNDYHDVQQLTAAVKKVQTIFGD